MDCREPRGVLCADACPCLLPIPMEAAEAGRCTSLRELCALERLLRLAGSWPACDDDEGACPAWLEWRCGGERGGSSCVERLSSFAGTEPLMEIISRLHPWALCVIGLLGGLLWVSPRQPISLRLCQPSSSPSMQQQ